MDVVAPPFSRFPIENFDGDREIFSAVWSPSAPRCSALWLSFRGVVQSFRLLACVYVALFTSSGSKVGLRFLNRESTNAGFVSDSRARSSFVDLPIHQPTSGGGGTAGRRASYLWRTPSIVASHSDWRSNFVWDNPARLRCFASRLYSRLATVPGCGVFFFGTSAASFMFSSSSFD